MSNGCGYEGCTVGETKRCALENDPATCPHRVTGSLVVEENAGDDTVDSNGSVGSPVLASPVETPTFPPSTTLALAAIDEMMVSRYVTVVGILGDPEAGKTACLASLYLLVSHAKLEGWSFADSRSLMAFEEIARGARRWNEGDPPAQMTVHTEMADDRQPGFLHIKLRRRSDDRSFDFALPDLPGEWSKDFIRTARSDRLEFMRSADVIWLVSDGRILSNKELRQGAITRLGQLAARLRALIIGKMPRLILVITHRDIVVPAVDTIRRIELELAKHDLEAEVVAVAPFSDDPNFGAGFGLDLLINATVREARKGEPFWPDSNPSEEQRSFLSYRRDND
ncbi:TRAFAC clade GTPase domain-containing protein [Rhizobium laguerreae]|uniref:TRAFAC clade GTPase domain-containing protein n=1 Tax=Rhizobium laguerreae TaxID=1076926 RepID=UPI001441B436|nr:hypothetical protein [Rhizobium laguerreae]NKM31826.1 hypothetical protein [Rhizobium laguerreae]